MSPYSLKHQRLDTDDFRTTKIQPTATRKVLATLISLLRLPDSRVKLKKQPEFAVATSYVSYGFLDSFSLLTNIFVIEWI